MPPDPGAPNLGNPDLGAAGLGGSVARVRAALRAAGHPDAVQEFPAGTRSAAEAAAAVGCDVAQIAKCVVFRAGDTPVLVIASGANRVDPAKAGAALGLALGRADAAFVRAATGFAIGGVAPVGHIADWHGGPVRALLDRDLLPLDPVWAAAGSPSHVFRTSAEALARLAGATVADIRQD